MNEPKVTEVTVPINILNQTLDYLSKQPFKDVYDIIVGLKTAADRSVEEQLSKEKSK